MARMCRNIRVLHNFEPSQIRIQGFDDTWKFFGRKTAAYRQVGNAFPPPVACSVAQQIPKRHPTDERRQLLDRKREVTCALRSMRHATPHISKDESDAG